MTSSRNALSSRDLRLLKRMFFIISLYVGSWVPIYAVALADVANDFPSIVYGGLSILPNFSLLLATINFCLNDKRVKQMLLRLVPRLQ